ncbi:MAG: hypothetical protein EXQ96_03725 [Alphaproteobacteria bacterium]|nr:hypothetical protein [Alphaproteobacteria bacterium]
MPTRPLLTEVTAALYGAWRLARLDASGMRRFDLSEAGFWRSFAAVGVAAPAYLALILLNHHQDPAPADVFSTLAFQGLVYVVQWAVFPLVMIPVSQALGLKRNYVPFIIAFNWAAVVQIAAFLPIALLMFAGLLPGTVAGLVTMIAFGAILYFQWFVARVALAANPIAAAAVVALDVALALIVQGFAARLG